MPRIRLRYLNGAKSGQVEIFPVLRAGSLRFGRDLDCDVRFSASEFKSVSRHHAIIDWSGDEPLIVRISDLLSRNGTFVNGRRIGRTTLLREGDRIQLSASGPQFEFQLEHVARSTLEAEEAHPAATPDATQEIPAADLFLTMAEPP
jgi:pSer/pThr/pTyr-binding forkhead associated (FHA) protein